MATLVGTTFPAPKVSKSTGSILCNYNVTSSGVNVVIEITASQGITASDLQSAFDSQAKAQKATAVAVPGLGDAAYMFTIDDASTNVDGIATTNIELLDGSEIIDLDGDVAATHMQAVAHYLVAQP
jgi:hypothetical protein